MITTTFTTAEQLSILQDALVIDQQLAAVQRHMAVAGTVVPMRTLGIWEEMVLDQRDLVLAEMAPVRAAATAWDNQD